ncbi:hypothetical protein K438DRAFT_1762347 [Mycena galopus ATCC 62051]|nr:hypothetical protein K438DRAFT_1762347 [Mycena galopus ATCC 62051]
MNSTAPTYLDNTTYKFNKAAVSRSLCAADDRDGNPPGPPKPTGPRAPLPLEERLNAAGFDLKVKERMNGNWNQARQESEGQKPNRNRRDTTNTKEDETRDESPHALATIPGQIADNRTVSTSAAEAQTHGDRRQLCAPRTQQQTDTPPNETKRMAVRRDETRRTKT